MQQETWYTAEEAVSAGLADRVGDGEAELPAGLDLAAFTAVPGRIAARLRSMPQAQAPRAADGNHAPTRSRAPIATPTRRTAPRAATRPTSTSTPRRRRRPWPQPRGQRRTPRPRLPLAVTGPGRILGIESMPLADKALPVHHTATTDEPWDGPAAVAAMPNDDTVLAYCHAWEDADAAAVPHKEGDDDADDQKSNYKFPHHHTKGGPANLAACRNGLARLSSADIPAGDDAGVKAHLQAHLDDGGRRPNDHAHIDISGMDLEQLRNALKGALT